MHKKHSQGPPARLQESWMDKATPKGDKKSFRGYLLESVWVALRRPAALLLPIFAVVQIQHTIMRFLEAAILHQHHHHMMSKWLGQPASIFSEHLETRETGHGRSKVDNRWSWGGSYDLSRIQQSGSQHLHQQSMMSRWLVKAVLRPHCFLAGQRPMAL